MKRSDIQKLIDEASKNSYDYSEFSDVFQKMRKALIDILDHGIETSIEDFMEGDENE